MKFVKIDDLKSGMRLARPVYSKNGVLLYDRNSRLNEVAIMSIRNFGLMGMFILEPAEPVPPMTQADIDFERFQTMTVFSIKDELEYMLNNSKPSKMPVIVASIIKNYGHLEDKINFNQDLRSKEDAIFRHTLNTSMLCAMIGHRMNILPSEQNDVVTASIVHELGKLIAKKSLPDIGEEIPESYMTRGFDLIESMYTSQPAIKRICTQAHRGKIVPNPKMTLGGRILIVANFFDKMTAMHAAGEPASEVAAIKALMADPEIFPKDAVQALIDSVNILSPGVSVELSTGDKALVLSENTDDVLRPMLLTFRDNTIMDLGSRGYEDIEILDVMKTMDNRHVMDTDALTKMGFGSSAPEFVEAPSET
ncbi:MAG: hypothetical protein K6E33_05475 [Lachnospiraceae bacterium]|nr:hypothetical protein [Lachnospiraceae bacterium]